MRSASSVLFIFFCRSCFALSGLDFIAQYLPSNPVIIEAGAHTGTDTFAMSNFWPDGVIHAFEPRPDVFKQLCEITQASNNVIRWQIALGDKEGEADFYLSASTDPSNHEGANAQSSLLRPLTETWPEEWTKLIDFNGKTQVLVVTLAEWAEQNKIDHIDFLWLDTQGNECQILQASPQVLKTVKVIKTEFSRMPVYEGTIPFAEYKKWLEDQGFRCVEEDACNHGDAIFVRSDIKKTP